MFGEKLARSCDSCGKPIGGGYELCGKCKIYLCLCCLIKLMYLTHTFPQKYPTCNREFITFDEYDKQNVKDCAEKAIEYKKTK
jgi:hypothetical protein